MRIRYHALVLAFVLSGACIYMTAADPISAQTQPVNSESAQKTVDLVQQRASGAESLRNSARQAVPQKRAGASGAAHETKETSAGHQAEFDSMLDKFRTRFGNIWRYQVWTIGDRPLTIHMIFVAVVILMLGIMATKIVIHRVAKRLLARPQIKPTTAATVEKLLLYFGYLLVVLFALRMVNIPLAAFAFLGGAIAIGIGFGAQNLINNFISGFIIMGEKPINIGDLIEVDGVLGQVEEIGARCTRIRTGENIRILVPNSSFLEKNITNWTLSDRLIRADVTVGVVYGSPVDQVETLLLEACNEFDAIRKSPEPYVLFTDFGDNALIFKVHFWINVTRIIERRLIESRLRFRIDDMFRRAGIVIAFPQRDVHLDSAQPLTIRMLENRDLVPGEKKKE